MQLLNRFTISLLISSIFISSCSQQTKEDITNQIGEGSDVIIPSFNADSAFQFVQDQIDFGPRVPNTASHENCREFLVDKLKAYGAEVTEQSFEATAYNGSPLALTNIIASFNKNATKKILLAAHWDTRPFADKDSIDIYTPIDGANDGGSGVAILIEVARNIRNDSSLKVGIDIILFDGEDYGSPKFEGEYNLPEGGYCLGSKYWASNKHEPNYSAYFGILLDMVGAADAKFYQEGISMQFAPSIVRKVWRHAQSIGYGHHFIAQKSEAITDDHVFINNPGKIPTIDIVEYNPDSEDYFGDYHHRHADNIAVIDPNTLKAVGQTVLKTIYLE